MGEWRIRCRRWRLHGRRPSGQMAKWTSYVIARRANLEFLLCCRQFVGIQVVAARNLFTSGGPGGVWQRHWEVVEMKKKSATGGEGQGRHLAALESNILAGHLPIIEHLAVTQYDDGSPRVPGFITIRTQGATWTIDVKDPDSGLSFRVIDPVLDKAIETVSLLLACDQAPWAPDAFLARQNGSKKKK